MLAERDRDWGDVKGHMRLWMNVFPFSCHLYNRFERLKRESLSIKKGLSFNMWTHRERNEKIGKKGGGCLSLFRGLSVKGCDSGRQPYLFCIVTLFLFEN